MKRSEKIKKYIKEILVQKAINDDIPMDMTQLDVDGLFDLAEACINAEKYLCVDEFGVAQQVLEIAKEENSDKMIDHIDNVCPTERFEIVFTAKYFLEHIGL